MRDEHRLTRRHRCTLSSFMEMRSSATLVEIEAIEDMAFACRGDVGEDAALEPDASDLPMRVCQRRSSSS